MRYRTAMLAAAAALLAHSALAADGAGLNIEVTPYTQYVWRGVVLTNGPVLQTSTTASYKGAHLNLFTNQDLNRVNKLRGKFNEVDYDFGYDYSLEKATFSGGILRYTYPNTEFESTTELYAGAALAGPLNPSVRGYFDVDAARGSRYVTADVAHSISLPKLGQNATWELAFAGGIGIGSSKHNAAYYGVEKAALADLHPSLALPISVGKFKITPRLGYGMLLSRELREGPAAKVHGFMGGLSLALNL